MSSFQSLNLFTPLLKTLENKGYKTPTPIQEKCIPMALEGVDILGIAQTGTGKTAAFSLPTLSALAENKVKIRSRGTRCLILTPTRELASQIEENIKIYGKGLGLSYAVVYGGVAARPQIIKLKKGVDIIIATPGRFLDLMRNKHVFLDQAQTFILDEADRMLDMGFINDVKTVLSRLPENKQTLLFSATMSPEINELANQFLRDPQVIEVAPESTTAENIFQKVHFVERINKPLLLRDLLQQEDVQQTLVFTRTKHGADRLARNLKKEEITIEAIHGDKSQAMREKALRKFKKKQVQVLVATDIAARGIDISSVTHVINYDLPEDPKSYVHRIGRTARAGREGTAISFCDPSEFKFLKAIEKNTKIKIVVDESHEYHVDCKVKKPAKKTRGFYRKKKSTGSHKKKYFPKKTKKKS